MSEEFDEQISNMTIKSDYKTRQFLKHMSFEMGIIVYNGLIHYEDKAIKIIKSQTNEVIFEKLQLTETKFIGIRYAPGINEFSYFLKSE